MTLGLRRVDAWRRALAKGLYLGESVDVVADEIKKLVTISRRDLDPIEGISGLILLNALPSTVRDQVTMRLGEQTSFSNVLTAAKRVWPSSSARRSTCAGFAGSNEIEGNRMSCHDQLSNLKRSWPTQRQGSAIEQMPTGSKVIRNVDRPAPRCYGCNRLGHFKRNCLAHRVKIQIEFSLSYLPMLSFVCNFEGINHRYFNRKQYRYLHLIPRKPNQFLN